MSRRAMVRKGSYGASLPSSFTVTQVYNDTFANLTGLAGMTTRGGITISPDGMILNCNSYFNDRIITLNLSSPNDLLSSYTILNNPATNDYNNALVFTNNGYRMWIARLGNYIRYSDVPVPYIPYPRTIIGAVGRSSGYIVGMFWSSDGMQVNEITRAASINPLFRYNCPTPYSFIGSTLDINLNCVFRFFRFYDNGNKALGYRLDGKIQLVELSIPNDILSTHTLIHQEIGIPLSQYTGGAITKDLKYIYVAREATCIQYRLDY